MSAVCDFYIECSERGIFPLERDKPRPAGVRLRMFYATNRWGSRFRVTGVSVADAINWWNDRPIPAPKGMREFLEDFCDCPRCPECGQIGRSHYFVATYDGEQMCVDCA